MKAKWLKWAALAMLSVAASGCGTANETGDAKTGEGAPRPQAPTDKPVELVFYSIARDSEETFNERYGNAIKKKFPNLTIKYVKRVAGETDLQQYVVTGQPIDLIWGSLGSWPAILDFKLETDMTDLVKTHGIDLSSFEPYLIDAIKQYGGGKLYGLPFENSVNVLYYNKDLFDKFGVSYPKDGMTWDELHDLAKKLNRSEGNVSYTGFSTSTNQTFITNQFGLPLIDPKTKKSTFGDPRWKRIVEGEFVQFAKETMYLDVADKLRKGGALNLANFNKDLVLAMYPSGPLLPLVQPKEMSAFKWDMAAMPTFPEAKGVGYSAYPNYMSVTAMSKEKPMAMEVLKFLTSKDFQTTLSKSGNMTVLQDKAIQDAMGQESAFKDKHYKAYFYNKFAPIGEKSDLDSKVPAYNSITSLLMKVAKGEIDTNTALRQAEEDVNKKIQEALAK
ncbi:ABC transporter substrate-binding protein [Paenibacillus sp. GYB003]|uniref:ABC transporter substrate-binding protein n=1 Tax=Paenibacillus sp. GYB003 TaxID=2994392 RepID=UPI002F96E496